MASGRILLLAFTVFCFVAITEGNQVNTFLPDSIAIFKL